MSSLYKDPKDIIYKVNIKQVNGRVCFLFECDCGKHGTDEVLDAFSYTPLELLTILQTDYDDNNK